MQVAMEVARRIGAMEMAGEAPSMDRRGIALLVARRIEMRKPNLPRDSNALHALIESEVGRYIREDRKLWSSVQRKGDEPSHLVLELLRRGMRDEAIKRYRRDSGLNLRDATRALDTLLQPLEDLHDH
ncbi:MAG: hypothetical protein PVSMB7_18740 [Chloroflexota bacterium]